MTVKVLMVCLGNICRSPTAEGVFRAKVEQAGLADVIMVDSAGTSDWHSGEAPNARTISAAAARHYDLSTQKARQIRHDDFHQFDYILAMDRQNLRELQRHCPESLLYKLGLFLDHGAAQTREVPDPYDQDRTVFEQVLDLTETASAALLETLIDKHRLKR